MSMHNRFVTVTPKSVHDMKNLQGRGLIKDQLSLPQTVQLRTKSVPQDKTLGPWGGSFSLKDFVKGSQSGGGTFRSQKKMRQLDLLTTDARSFSTADTTVSRVDKDRRKFERENSSNDERMKNEHKSLSSLLQEMSREDAPSDDNRLGRSRDGVATRMYGRKNNRSASGVSSNGGGFSGSPPGRPNSSLSTAERIRQESVVTRNCNPSDPFDNPLWNRNELSSKETRQNLQMKENEMNCSVESRSVSTITRATSGPATNYNLFSYKPSVQSTPSVVERCREKLGRSPRREENWTLVRAGSRQSNLDLAERCFHEVMLSTPSSGDSVSARDSVPPIFSGIYPRYPETSLGIDRQAGSHERKRTLPMRPCPPPPRNEEEEQYTQSLCFKRLSMEESRLSQVSTCIGMNSSFGSDHGEYQMIGHNRERFQVDMAAMKSNLRDLSRHTSVTDPSTSRSTNVVINEDFSQSVDNSQPLNWWNVADKSELPLPPVHQGHYEPWDERASAISSKSGSKCSNAYNLQSADPIFGHEDLSEKDNIPATSYSTVKGSSSTMPDAELLSSPEYEYTRAEFHDPDYVKDCYGEGKDYCSGQESNKREPYVENYARVLSAPLTSQNKEVTSSTNSQVRWDCETVFESQNSSSSHSLNQWDRLESQQSYFHDMRVPQQQLLGVVSFAEPPVRSSPPGFHQTASEPSMFIQSPARNLQNGRSSIYASFNSPKVEDSTMTRQHSSWSEMAQF